MGYNLACISVSRTFSASSGAPARLSFESQEKEEGQTDRLTLTEGVCRGQERDRVACFAWRTDRSESRNDRFELICPRARKIEAVSTACRVRPRTILTGRARPTLIRERGQFDSDEQVPRGKGSEQLHVLGEGALVIGWWRMT
jgi:hypothetical protein